MQRWEIRFGLLFWPILGVVWAKIVLNFGRMRTKQKPYQLISITRTNQSNKLMIEWYSNPTPKPPRYSQFLPKVRMWKDPRTHTANDWGGFGFWSGHLVVSVLWSMLTSTIAPFRSISEPLRVCCAALCQSKRLYCVWVLIMVCMFSFSFRVLCRTTKIQWNPKSSATKFEFGLKQHQPSEHYWSVWSDKKDQNWFTKPIMMVRTH